MKFDIDKISFKKIIASILICFLPALIGSVFTYPAIPNWYASLNKPFFSPPNWLFGPAWTILYLLMGISFYIIWKRGIKSKEEKNAVYIFFVQLILNALWSFLFFGLRSPFLGFVCIIFLWFSIALTIWKFWRLEKISGILLLPYIGWVSFASILNFFVWILN